MFWLWSSNYADKFPNLLGEYDIYLTVDWTKEIPHTLFMQMTIIQSKIQNS